ncbi:MAG: polysaccharide deacetylase family protein [Gemmatimonadales bacterium]
MSARRLRATVSLDLDDLWTYLKTRGDPAWASYPTYLPVIVPRVLQRLDELNLRITFFVVGRDASIEANAPFMRAIADRGHEIGNHSFEHDCWLHRHRPEHLEADIRRAEESIERATGRRPTGFRGPGFSWSSDLLEILASRGYEYDASTLPSVVGPLARTYFLWTARLSPEERQEREALFGSFGDAMRPLDPYKWNLSGGRKLLEIPVTTMPVARLPFHLSYLLYLASFSWALMAAYLGMALTLCRLFRVEPSFLLHPPDLLDASEAPGLEFFPGMMLSADRKASVFRYALERIQRHFDVLPLSAFARDPASGACLRLLEAHRSFRHAAPAELRSRPSLSHADTEVYRET